MSFDGGRLVVVVASCLLLCVCSMVDKVELCGCVFVSVVFWCPCVCQDKVVLFFCCLALLLVLECFSA